MTNIDNRVSGFGAHASSPSSESAADIAPNPMGTPILISWSMSLRFQVRTPLSLRERVACVIPRSSARADCGVCVSFKKRCTA
nr:MAG TPA: hypothetical protein [Caudoviricetes sp.]